MNTHDIELPPLPSPFSTVDPMGSGAKNYTLKDMGEYARAYARAALQSQDREDAERYRWVKRHAHPNRGFDEWCLPYIDYVDDNLDAAIDHARRAEGDGE